MEMPKNKAGGTGTAERFNKPKGITRDSRGNLYVLGTDNSTIRKVTPTGAVTTISLVQIALLCGFY
jgi:hypothetical protein